MTGRFLIIRDLQVAEDIGARAKLGWFDEEFNFYGTVFLENDEEYYLVSRNPRKIYDFINHSQTEGIYCVPMERLCQKRAVPAGLKEDIEKTLEVDLAKRLQEKYPKEFLSQFQQCFQDVCNNSAKDYLSQYQQAIDGIFDEEKLKLFERLLNHAFGAKILNKATYVEFNQWLLMAYKDMGEIFTAKDIFSKDFYCLSYEINNQRKLVINAQKERIYEKCEALLSKGILCAPIYDKRYWYNHEYRLNDARRDFEQWLYSETMTVFFNYGGRLNQLPAAVEGIEYQRMKDNFIKIYGQTIIPFLKYYQTKWHIASI